MPRFRLANAIDAASATGWRTLDFAFPADDGNHRDIAERALAEALGCEHVVVLAGLGTSLCISDSTDEKKQLFPTMAKLWSVVESEFGAELLTHVQTAVGFTGTKNVEDLLSRCQMKLILDPPEEVDVLGEGPLTDSQTIASLVRVAETVIRLECRKALRSEDTSVHEDFLRRLVRRDVRRPRANLFTTNYDLCFETAAARIGLPLMDGFAFTVPPRFQPEVFDYDIVTSSTYSKNPDFVPRLLRFYKMHGSVNWERQEGGVAKVADTENPVLIYPRSGKYAASYSPPFLEMASRFQGLLRQRNVGVVAIGCGFNDRHIAEPLFSAVKSNPSLRLVVCAPDLCQADALDQGIPCALRANLILEQIDHLVENDDSRITFVNGLFQDVVRLMPSVPLHSDSEQHESRIRELELELVKRKSQTSFDL